MRDTILFSIKKFYPPPPVDFVNTFLTFYRNNKPNNYCDISITHPIKKGFK